MQIVQLNFRQGNLILITKAICSRKEVIYFPDFHLSQ